MTNIFLNKDAKIALYVPQKVSYGIIIEYFYNFTSYRIFFIKGLYNVSYSVIFIEILSYRIVMVSFIYFHVIQGNLKTFSYVRLYGTFMYTTCRTILKTQYTSYSLYVTIMYTTYRKILKTQDTFYNIPICMYVWNIYVDNIQDNY